VVPLGSSSCLIPDPVKARPFPSALTTMALGHSRRRWFGTCSCKPVPRGLPSSDKQLHATWPHGLSRSWRTIVGKPHLTLLSSNRTSIVFSISLLQGTLLIPFLVIDQLSSSVASQTVAVGTIITDRPPHRSVRARLRIRLLPWINGGKAACRTPPIPWDMQFPLCVGSMWD
jgi:hypothetical protein